MDKNANFVVTDDKSTFDYLISHGYELINESNGKWIFLNCRKLTFDSKQKIIFTNKLCI